MLRTLLGTMRASVIALAVLLLSFDDETIPLSTNNLPHFQNVSRDYHPIWFIRLRIIAL